MNLVQAFKGYNLKPETTRPLSLFLMSAVAVAYIQRLPNYVGFSYKVTAIVGKLGTMTYYIDKDHVVNETEKLLEKEQDLNAVLKKADDIYDSIKKETDTLTRLSPKEVLAKACILYPHYFVSLCIYNNFMRYLGNEEEKGKLTKETVKRLSEGRDKVAGLYHIIEGFVKKAANELDKELKFDYDLLSMMTLHEMEHFLKTLTLSAALRNELEQRKKGYAYLSVGSKNFLLADQKQLQALHESLAVADEASVELKGYPVYPGKVTGKVYNLTEKNPSPPQQGCIIVTTMTFTTDTPLIAKSAALVTDEGGVLSHAAVVARELKKPAIISTKSASKLFKTGDMIEVDATHGIVRKVVD